MKKLLSVLIAAAFGLTAAGAFAADTTAPAEPAAVPAKADKPMVKKEKKRTHAKKRLHNPAKAAAPAEAGK